MGEPTDDPGDDEAASLAMLQQLMAGRRALIGKLRPHQPTGPRQELSTQDVFQALGTLQNRPSSPNTRSEEHTSELQSLMRISYAVFCMKKQNSNTNRTKCPTS